MARWRRSRIIGILTCGINSNWNSYEGGDYVRLNTLPYCPTISLYLGTYSYIPIFFIDRWKRWKRRRWLKSFESLTSLSKMPAEVGCAVSHNDLSGVCIVPTELLEAVNIMAEKLLPTIVICSSYPAKQLFYLLCLLTIENCQLHRSDVNWEKDAVNRAQIFKRCLSG